MRRLTIQDLANLCNYTWEVERSFGFHMNPLAFKRLIEKTPDSVLRSILESLSEVFRTVREIGCVEFELKAEGQHPFYAALGGFRTPTAHAAGVEEYINPLPTQIKVGDSNAEPIAKQVD